MGIEGAERMNIMQKNDFQWFIDNYKSLYEKYGESFIAIKNKVVLGVFKSIRQGLDEICKTEELGSFIIQKCNGDETGYTNYIAHVNF